MLRVSSINCCLSNSKSVVSQFENEEEDDDDDDDDGGGGGDEQI